MVFCLVGVSWSWRFFEKVQGGGFLVRVSRWKCEIRNLTMNEFSWGFDRSLCKVWIIGWWNIYLVGEQSEVIVNFHWMAIFAKFMICEIMNLNLNFWLVCFITKLIVFACKYLVVLFEVICFVSFVNLCLLTFLVCVMTK